MTMKKRDRRNLNPTAPAIVATYKWNERYAAQAGGSMDFWDSLSECERKYCIECAEKVQGAHMVEG